MPCTLALILCIIGGTRLTSSDPTKQSSGKTFAKVGIIIFIVSFLDIVLLALFTIPASRKVPSSERRIFHAVLAAFPFLVVRLLYTVISDFSNSKKFAVYGGDPYVQLGMALIPELIVVLLYSVVGLTAPSVRNQAVAQEEGLHGRGK
jgi:hypothetical protein